YKFIDVTRNIVPFFVNDLSAYYLDYTKDTLYCDDKNDFERRAIQSTVYDILHGTLRLLTPIMPHTTSEAYSFLPGKRYEDVYLEHMPSRVKVKDPVMHEKFDIFMQLRDQVLKHLELARAAKVIGKSLEAHLNLVVTEETLDAIKFMDIKDSLHKAFIVSSYSLTIGKENQVTVTKAEG